MTKFTLDRDSNPSNRPAVAHPVRGDGTDAKGRIGLDTFRRVTRDEATELMVHHLSLAAVFYEATPVDEAAVLAEVERLLASDVPNHDCPELVGARAWLTAMNAYYAALKAKQDKEDR